MTQLPPYHDVNDQAVTFQQSSTDQANDATAHPYASSECSINCPPKASPSSQPFLDKDEDDSEDGAFEEESFGQNPFKPLPNLPEEKPTVLTTRALIIGLFAGALVNASNVYLGLKSGWTFGANLFGVSHGFGLT